MQNLASDPLLALADRFGPAPQEGSVLRGQSLSGLAYDRFIAALFDCTLTPGTIISQNELVRILEVPVAPLRDALRVLQTEGLLTIHPRSGIELIKPDFGMIRHTYQLRGILERAAVRSFAEVAQLDILDGLIECQHAVIAAVSGRDLTTQAGAAVEQIDLGMHAQILACLHNPLIQNTYRQTHSFARLILLGRKYRLSGQLTIRTMTEHLDILDACRRRDPHAAEAAVEVHFARAMQRAMG